MGVFNKYFQDSYLKSLISIRYGKKYFKILKNSNLKILVLTDFHKKYLEKLGVDGSKLFVFRNYLNVNNSILNLVVLGKTQSIIIFKRYIKKFLEIDENF